MSVVKTILFPPPLRDSSLSKPEQLYMFTLQGLLPLNIVDTTAGNVTLALPNPGLDNSQTGQSAQNQELIYIKGSADANTVTITGAISGAVTLTAQFQVARFKSDAVAWWEACCGTSGGGGGGGVAVGQNVYPTFSTLVGHATGGAGGRTYGTWLSSRLIQVTPTSWKISISVNGGGVDLGPIAVLKTLTDDLNVISSTPILFGGNASPSLADGIHVSDAISLTLDTAHDYWIMHFVKNTSAGWIDYGPSPVAATLLAPFGYTLAWAANVIAVTPINPATTFGTVGSLLNQVVSA